MPIHLRPFSRRKFLARSLVACAGLALKPLTFAAARRTDADSWALLSDIHVAADRGLIARGINMTDHFRQTSEEVLALAKRPSGVFINGDCAYNSGEKGDYSLVAELLAPIRKDGIAVHLALGNHDNRDRFWEGFENTAKRPIADKQTAFLKSSNLNWFVLDSLEKTLSTPGLLGQEQLDWLAKTLDGNQGKPAVIMIHHNPGVDKNISGLKDTEAFFNIIRPRKQVKAYIFGHTHDWKVESDPSGIHLVNLPPVAYIFKEGNPSGWVHATAGRTNMRLELRCLDTKHPAHGQIHDLEWRT